MSKEVKYKIAFMSPLVFVIAFLVIGVFSIQTSTPIVHAATCPADGTGDGDGDDTKITISSNTTWAATDGTAWDCSGLDLDVTGTAILTLAGTIASGYIPQLTIDNISVGSS
ncbi:MAG: hypothetical protein Q8P30_04735, partial [Candidatus Uhrbacteria bacterium]|nr:hypothetical protein [Candidatus Uhrbacteria bacterium]